MTYKKLYILFLISLLFINNIFPKGNLSDKENSYINNILDFRLQLRTYNNIDECLVNLEKYQNEIYKSSDYKKFDEETILIIDNLLIVAKFNCIYENNIHDNQLKPLILNQFEKIIEYNKQVTLENRNKWYNVTAYDVINTSLQFLPTKDAIVYGLEEKDSYNFMMKKYPDFSYLFINSGLWYVFAPAFGGGSDEKALNYFRNAIYSASSNYESYYANIYMSQLLFERKIYEESEKFLNKADLIIPGNKYIEFIKKLNDNDYSLYYYTNNKEKVDKKLGND